MNLKAALKNESYGTDEFVRNLSVEVTTCFTALMMKVYLVSKIIESKPRPDFRKFTSTTSPAKKKGRATKKKSDVTFSDLGPIPHQIDVMVDFFYELDNGVTGVLGLLSRKQISEQFKDYDMRNKWYNFESLLRNVNYKSGVNSLYGRNVVNYNTIKKYMIIYHEILVWYMKNALCFHTKGANCSPRASKQYIKSMKNFLDCLMAKSSLRVSMSHSYNQVDLDNHFKKQRKSKQVFTIINLRHLDIKLLTHQDFYQYFLPKLIQNSFVLGTMILLGEKWVPVEFHQQGDTNIAETGKVLLPLHSPLVFHYVLNYKDTLSNYYNINFEINDDRVTLSPCKLGTGKIDLAHFKVTKGLYLVKQWLITKFVDHGTNLGVNVVLSLETACFFSYDHVMETIEGLVLTKRRFLKGAMVPELREENVPYFQRNDRLYIFPTAGVLTKTQFVHVKFEDRQEQLVTGILELPGLEDKHKNQTCLTRFLQYDVNSQQEVHQQIFMEHIPYVFREIFVIDPEVVERHTWVEELIHNSYLPEMGTIFRPLTEKLARYLLEKSDDLSSANLVVQFLDDNVVNNYGKGTGELNPAFKHLQATISTRGNVDQQLLASARKKKANESKPSGIDTTKGNSKDAGLTAKRSKTGEKEGSNEMEEEVRDLAETPIHVLVTLPKFPLRIAGPPPESFDLSVVLKEPDPELMYQGGAAFPVLPILSGFTSERIQLSTH
eukprot:jgi/Psemu1/25089/gm1.25089_g